MEKLNEIANKISQNYDELKTNLHTGFKALFSPLKDASNKVREEIKEAAKPVGDAIDKVYIKPLHDAHSKTREVVKEMTKPISDAVDKVYIKPLHDAHNKTREVVKEVTKPVSDAVDKLKESITEIRDKIKEAAKIQPQEPEKDAQNKDVQKNKPAAGR